MTLQQPPRLRLARLLAKLRQRTRLSKFQLAQQTNLSLATVQKLEHGDATNLRARTAYALADVFGVSVLELLQAFLDDLPPAAAVATTEAAPTGAEEPSQTEQSGPGGRP